MEDEAVLVELWMSPSSVAAYEAGIACRRVVLARREDGTFELGLATTWREMAAAGVRLSFEGDRG